MIDHLIVLLLEARVRDAGHHAKLLVRVRQPLEELDQVVHGRDAVPLPAQDQGRQVDLRRVHQRQLRAHVHVGAGRHGIVQRENRRGEGLDGGVIRGARMVARENALHERAIDRPPVPGLEFGQLLLALGQRRAACAGPDESIEREARHALRMPLREQRGLERARGDAVDEQLFFPSGFQDVLACNIQIVGAVGNIKVDRPLLVRAAVALVVQAPGVVAARREPLHHRGIGPPGHREVESGLRGHRGAVHEQDGRFRRGASGRRLAPEEEPNIARWGLLACPVLGTLHLSSCAKLAFRIIKSAGP